MDKAKINGIVKKIKKMRAESAKEKNAPKEPSKFSMVISSRPEKLIACVTAAVSLCILSSGKKKNGKKKKKPLYKRFIANYKLAGSALDSTIAAELKRQSEREFKDEKLERMEIENAIKFTL